MLSQATRPQVEKNLSPRPASPREPAASQHQPPYKHSSKYYFRAGVAILLCVVLGIVALIGAIGILLPDEEAQKKEWIKQARERRAQLAAIEAAKTPEQRAAEEKARIAAAKARAEKEAHEAATKAAREAAKKRQDEAVNRAAIGARILKKATRNPDAFKLESAYVIHGSGAVCYEYRAQNGFGGMNAGQAVLSSDGKKFLTNEMNGFTRLWNQECANKAGQEVGTAIRWFAL
jgi:hypothetical protein